MTEAEQTEGTEQTLASRGPSLALNVQSAKGRRYWIEISDLNWWIVLLLYTLGAVISAGTFYTAELAEHRHIPYFFPLLTEFTGYYTQLLLLPLIILGFGRFPIKRTNWYWTIPLQLGFSIVFGAIHTCLMFLSRQFLYHVLGLGPYDYGEMAYRFLMEYHKQFLHFWGIYVVLQFVAHYRLGREREQQAAALELRAAELQKQLAQAQLQTLRTQLNPHFLFNTLNMISSVMYTDVNRADQMIACLSRMLRMSLEENVGARVPVRRELEFVNCAVELVRARFEDRVDISIDCQPDALDFLLPNLLLYTLVENSIKHHDFDRDPVARVVARVQRDGASLSVDVLDNGPGMESTSKAIRHGVGLANTQQRLHGLYGEHYRLEFLNRPEGGLHVHVGIPAELCSASAPESSHAPAPPPGDRLQALSAQT